MDQEKTAQTRDRLRQLRVFCHTARLESMSQAADRMSLSQPAVSRQIRALEDELSIALFERRGPHISLTPAGRSFLRLAEPLVEGVDSLPQTFSEDLSKNVSGRVRIWAGLTSAAFILPDYLLRFQARYPDVEVRIETRSGEEGLQLILDREADFGVGAMEVPPKGFEFRHLLTSEHTLITPLDHPLANNETVSVEDLLPYRWILPAPDTYTRLMIDSVARYLNQTFNIAIETGSWSVIKRYVAVGLGIATVPSICLREEDRVCRIPFDEGINAYARPRNYGIILRRPAFLPLAASKLIQIMDPSFPGAAAAPEEPR